jgi:hypothetical protein
VLTQKKPSLPKSIESTWATNCYTRQRNFLPHAFTLSLNRYERLKAIIHKWKRIPCCRIEHCYGNWICKFVEKVDRYRQIKVTCFLLLSLHCYHLLFVFCSRSSSRLFNFQAINWNHEIIIPFPTKIPISYVMSAKWQCRSIKFFFDDEGSSNRAF